MEKVKIDFLPAQTEFMRYGKNIQVDEKDVAIYQGGFGSGKTFAGCWLGYFLADKYPRSVGLSCAKEYTLLKRTTIKQYFEILETLNKKSGKDFKYNKTDHVLTLKNGSEIWFMGVEDSEKFKSMNLHWIQIEECSQISDSVFRDLLGRLRNTYRGSNWGDFRYRLFGHTNPQANKGWIFKRFVEEAPYNYRRILAPTTNNTHLPKSFVEDMRTAYNPEYYNIFVLGQDGDYASGLIVKNFSREKHIKTLKYNPDLPIHITCDFNVDPMCWIIAHKDDNNVFFLDEIVIENTTTRQAIREFLTRYPNHQNKIIINGDASGDNRSTQSEFTNYAIIREELIKYGQENKKENYENPVFELRDYNPPIKNRINAFNARILNKNNEVRLFIDKKCKWLLYNIENLSYKEGTSLPDIPTINKIKNDRDSKFLMHPFDAASYLTEFYWRIK